MDQRVQLRDRVASACTETYSFSDHDSCCYYSYCCSYLLLLLLLLHHAPAGELPIGLLQNGTLEDRPSLANGEDFNFRPLRTRECSFAIAFFRNWSSSLCSALACDATCRPGGLVAWLPGSTPEFLTGRKSRSETPQMLRNPLSSTQLNLSAVRPSNLTFQAHHICACDHCFHRVACVSPPSRTGFSNRFRVEVCAVPS